MGGRRAVKPLQNRNEMVAGRGKRAARKKVAGRTGAATMRDSEDHQGLTLVLSCPLSSVGGQAENNSRESTVLYGAFLSSTVFNSELWN